MHISENLRPASSRVRARRGEGDRLRDEILNAAEALLVETADANSVSIRAISQIVGVTAPSIYRHFDDKDALLLATCERAYDRFDDYLVAEAGKVDDPLHEIKAQARAYLRFALDHPGHYRILFMTPGTHVHADPETHANALNPAKSEMKALVRLVGAIEASIRAGLVVQIASTEQMALLLWSMVHGIASLRIAQPEMPWPDLDRQVDELFMALATGMCTEVAKARMGSRI